MNKQLCTRRTELSQRLYDISGFSGAMLDRSDPVRDIRTGGDVRPRDALFLTFGMSIYRSLAVERVSS
jgi:hypothetical protein